MFDKDILRKHIMIITMCFLVNCSWAFPILNNPYPSEESLENIYYSTFTESPKTLDPVKSYSSNEYQFLGQIYEPLLSYDYFVRPLQLIPLTALKMPEIIYLNAEKKPIKSAREPVSYTQYVITIKPNIYYQPHPAFAKKSKNVHRYFNLSPDYIESHHIKSLEDFKFSATRELIVDDYIYQIKRLANPSNNSPIYGLLSTYIEGFKAFSMVLPKQHSFIDLRQYPLQGLRKINDYQFSLTLKGSYEQFKFWLAMPFFSPIPWEVDKFYAEPGMDEQNLNLGWFPVGTGPFMMTENNPNSRMVLEKNPNYRIELISKNSTQEDLHAGYTRPTNVALPLISKAIFSLEKEAIPRWGKFLQGYYDMSGISADSFDQAITLTVNGKAKVSDSLKKKGIHLESVVEPNIYYMGFNMLDDTVGGSSLRAKKLRQAISIAIDYEEFIAIFLNGRGSAAQGPIPPGIFGFKTHASDINHVVYQNNHNHLTRVSIKKAQLLMKQAGYPGGIDSSTGKPLVLNYDISASGGPDEKAQLNWMRKQFDKIGIALNIRATQYNRFQEKMRSGNAQIFNWGWNADYPDPENFLFLLYGPNGKVKHGGENAANYQNPTFDQLFLEMKRLPNNQRRAEIIKKMVAIVRDDAPWVWGINSENLILSQSWVSPIKPSGMIQNTLKYVNIDVTLRNKLRHRWNQPILWPLFALFIGFCLFTIPFVMAYIQRQHQKAARYDL